MRSKGMPGTATRAVRRKKAAGEERARAASAAPSLAELRRRAVHRLRELSAALARLQQQTAEAAVECARLRADGAPSASAAAMDHTPTQPQPDLRQTLADNARLRQELVRLIGFLEEVSGSLPEPSVDGFEENVPVRG